MMGFVGSHVMVFASLARAATGSFLDAAWQGLALALFAAAGLRLVPKTPAAIRFAIWFAVFLIVVALPGVAIFRHRDVVAAAAGVEPRAWLTLDARWSLAIAALWGIASAVRAGTLVAAAMRVRELWQQAKPVESPMIGSLQVGRARLCVSDLVDRPTVIGFLSPKIVMPAWLLEKLTPAELEQIVLHEAGHLQRADDWMNLLQKIALVIFPLNPALLWVERRLCFERELACDERVLRTTGAPKAYATCLATLAEYRLHRRGFSLGLALGFAGTLARESELGQRIGRILRRDASMPPAQARLVASGAMLALLVGAIGLARCPQRVAFSGEAPQTQAATLHAPSMVLPAAGGYQPVVFHPPVKVSRVEPSQQVRARRPNNTKQRSARWLMVTAWQSDDGSRITLTTQRQAVESAKPVLLPVLATPEQDTTQQFHRYAAVPTRDGWLVFQL